MFTTTHDITIALRVSIPTPADGAAPTPAELREIVIAGLRGFIFAAADGSEVEILDAAPRVGHLPPA